MELLKSGINLHDFSKRQKSNNDLVDRISALPDSILGVILSFLSTQEAVATAVLSKRWEFAWVTVHNLYFIDYSCWKIDEFKNLKIDEVKYMKFVRFVNRVMLLHEVGLLYKFKLMLSNNRVLSHANPSPWVSTAIAKNVRDLSLCGEYDLPSSVFSCESLHSLYLSGPMYVSPAAFVVNLPRLEALTLHTIYFRSEEAFEKVTSGCPMLNYLSLNIYDKVPKCLSNLKKVRLTRYHSLENERKMVCDMLKHGSALEVMQLQCWNGNVGEEYEWVQEICGFPRKSPVCELQFSGWCNTEYNSPASDISKNFLG